MSESYVYILRCADGTLYTGWTTDPAARLAAHNGKSGGGAKYTRGRRPCTLVYIERLPDKQAAMRRECEIKRLPRAEKEALCATKASEKNGDPL